MAANITHLCLFLKKKKDFIDSDNEHKRVLPVQRSLVPVHHQVTVQSGFGADGIPGLLFTSLTVDVVFPENAKTRPSGEPYPMAPEDPIRLPFIWAAPR